MGRLLEIGFLLRLGLCCGTSCTCFIPHHLDFQHWRAYCARARFSSPFAADTALLPGCNGDPIRSRRFLIFWIYSATSMAVVLAVQC